MIDLQTADKALKSVYLGVVSEQLNIGVNPLLAKIEQTTSDVWGKDIIKLVTYGINGGIGAGSETGELPIAAGNNYARFRLELKNLFGSIEISDKAIRASQNSSGAFVNLLNAEMEGLLKASKFNIGRMLFGDGSGKLASVSVANSSASNVIKVNSVKNFLEGVVVDIYNANGTIKSAGLRVLGIDRNAKSVTLSKSVASVATGDYITVQNSNGNELTGLGAIFSNNDLYGLKRSENEWLKPYVKTSAGTMDTAVIQSGIDYIEEISGGAVDLILCSYDVRRMYLESMAANRFNLDYMTVDGGYKAISYNGVPVVADRFIEDGTMYLLNTENFKMHQLCDWRWLEGDNGNVIKQNIGHATYKATLVKYADIICDKPVGQAKISGFTA